jgi:hypothetical protein
MPSPVGHALGAIAVGWKIVPHHRWRDAAVLALVAIAPDLDLLVHDHRGMSHSLGVAVLAGLAASAAAAPPLRRDRLRWGLAVALAWASHVALDWLSNDTRPPIGVMALWPFTRDYYKAPIEIFPAVSRHYWETRFWIYNAKALIVEVAILGPIAALIVIFGGRRRPWPWDRRRST